VQLIAKGKSEKEVVRQVLELSHELNASLKDSGIKILGPAPCATSKQHGFYFWNFYLKGPRMELMREFLDRALVKFKKKGIVLSVDVDPQ
jgi:primosomal protein N'